MRRMAAGGAAVLLSVRAVVVLAQAPDFSGTWKLDPGRSRIAETAGLAGLVGAGAPGTLHVTQPANGTLVIESPINESHARLYRPGSRVSTPVTVGQAGSITMLSRWEGRSLVSEGTRETAAGTSPVATHVKEVLSVSADGRTLGIEVTATTAAGDKSVSTMTYTRTRDAGPCQSWPTPCKTAPR